MTKPRAPRLPLLLALCIVPAGCGGDESASATGSWRAEREQRGDTTIVRTLAGSVWGDTMTLVPDLAIGALEGEDAYMFGRVAGVEVDPEGRILVVDAQAQEVRVFSAEGEHLRTLGREGGGPGEFRGADQVRAASDGRIIVRDQRAGRFSVFSPEGDYVGGWPLASGFSTSSPFFLDAEDRVLNPTFSDRLVRYDLDGTAMDTLPNPTRGYRPPMLEVTSGGGTATYGIPFTPTETWTVTGAGRFVFGVTDTYAFERWEGDGRVLRVERDVEPVAVAGGEAAWARERTTRTIRRYNDPAWRWQGPDVPATKPYWSTILPGRDGTFWVRRETAAEEEENPYWDAADPETTSRTRWVSPTLMDVFDEEGRYLGAVRLPAGVQLLPRPVVSADRVWAVAAHELGYPQVVRFRVEPGEPEHTMAGGS